MAIDFSTYNKHQIILTSDRLIFNAKDDSLFLLAKKDIALSMGGDLHINVGAVGSKTAKMIINSPKIEMGTGTDMQSVAKGDAAVAALNEIVTEIAKFAEALKTATGTVTGGTAELLTINVAADALTKKLPKIQKDLDKIKSSTTFTS